MDVMLDIRLSMWIYHQRFRLSLLLRKEKNLESNVRSITKALTYRFWQSLNTFIISFLVTGKLEMAAAIVSIEVFIKIIVYFWHERIWSHIRWGRK